MRRERRKGYAVWRDAGRRAEVRFVGRGPAGSREDVLAAVTGGDGGPPARGLAAARQVHSAIVLDAVAAGSCGDGDALVTSEEGLALSVVTADCLPVLIEAGDAIAAVHAGWRGLAAGIVAATVERLRERGAPPAAEWTAWIGPAIGSCCYEVGREVADAVAAASSPAVVIETAAKPHLDLVAAARHQLRAAGIEDVRAVAVCTRCEAADLWSYRRDGSRAGRNHAFIAITGEAREQAHPASRRASASPAKASPGARPPTAPG